MDGNLVYFNPSVETVGKRKHLLFLEKSGFNIDKVYGVEDFKKYLESSSPSGIILMEDDLLEQLVQLTDIPILVILKPEKNFVDLMEKYPDNTIFFRFENDPINTILETVKLIDNLSKY